MKKKFEDRFQEIPHTTELQTDVYHHIRLKNPNQTIATRTYSCPRKYWEAWSTLIQQHLDAGHICPSSSPYVSPSFIVLKTDPTILPCCVNDFRELTQRTKFD